MFKGWIKSHERMGPEGKPYTKLRYYESAILYDTESGLPRWLV